MATAPESSGLVCDTCGEPIEDIGVAMVFFNHAEGKAFNLRLAHKGRRCDPDTEDSSIELSWLEEDGLYQLMQLAHNHEWSAADLKRLIAITWLTAPDDGLGLGTLERAAARRDRESAK